FAFVRVMEGYWGIGLVRGTATDICTEIQRRRKGELQNRKRAGDLLAAERLRDYPPDERRLLPTRLGNVLRSMEDRAGPRYGFLTVTVWPHLFAVLPDHLRSQL